MDYEPIYSDDGTRTVEYVARRTLVTDEWNGFSFCRSLNVVVSYDDVQDYAERSIDQLPIEYRPTPQRDALDRGEQAFRLPPHDLDGVPRWVFVNSERIREEGPRRAIRWNLIDRSGRIYIFNSR